MKDKLERGLCNLSGKLPFSIRSRIYKVVGICNSSTETSHNITFDHPSQVKIGDNSFINHHVRFDVGWTKNHFITLGSRVWIAPFVCFYCTSHEIGGVEQRAGINTYKSITVGDGVWIGANAVILQGVSIGEGSIIGAGSVVTKDVPCNEFWAGSPAKFVRKL